jgi:hypothetical protein
MNLRNIHRWYAAWSLVVFLVAVVWGFQQIGSPARERLRRIDEQRLRDLQGIRRALEILCVDRAGPVPRMMDRLPQTLAEIDAKARRGDAVGWALALTDPETSQPYEYRAVGENEVELCAEFALPRHRRWEPFWNHTAGKACFRLNLLDPAAPFEGRGQVAARIPGEVPPPSGPSGKD